MPAAISPLAPAYAAVAPSPPQPPVVVNVLDVFARVCPTNDDGSAAAVPYAQPWAAQCCGDAMTALVLRQAAPAAAGEDATGGGGGGGMVPLAELPRFACAPRRAPLPPPAAAAAAAALAAAVPPADGSVSCGAVLDDYCDCADGADEPTTAACAGTSASGGGGLFFCASGALAVRGGALAPPAADAAPPPPSQLPPAQLAGLSREALARAGYVPADKVRDGVRDCAGGEDEL